MIYKNCILEKQKYSLSIDLEKELQQYSKSLITQYGFSCGNNKDYLRLYLNLQKRIISSIPRKVVKSSEFECPSEYRHALCEIELKIQNGSSLVPYMSDKVLDLTYEDLLLCDWNIHHLHLSCRLRSDGFIKRSDYELFVFVTNETVYFIQIYPHNRKHLYSTQEMVRIIHRNWPYLISKYKIKGIVSGGEEITDESYDLLRNNGISAFVDVGNGNIYMSFGGGYASNKSSVDVTRGTFYWKELMHNYQSLVLRESKNIIKTIYQIRGNDTDCDLCFSLICINDDTLTLIENNNGICLQLFKSKNYYRMFYPKDLISIEEFQNIRNSYRLKIT